MLGPCTHSHGQTARLSAGSHTLVASCLSVLASVGCTSPQHHMIELPAKVAYYQDLKPGQNNLSFAKGSGLRTRMVNLQPCTGRVTPKPGQ